MALGRLVAGSLASQYDNVCATHLTGFAVGEQLAATRLGRLFSGRGGTPLRISLRSLSLTLPHSARNRAAHSRASTPHGIVFDRAVSRGITSCPGFRPVVRVQFPITTPLLRQ